MKKYLFPLIATIALIGVALGCSSNSTDDPPEPTRVVPKAESFKLNHASLTLAVDQPAQLRVESVEPPDSRDPNDIGVITYTSEDPDKVHVDTYGGRVIARKGTAGAGVRIVAKHIDLPEEKDWQYCSVVVDVPLKGIKTVPSQQTLTIVPNTPLPYFTIDVEFDPMDASNQSIDWSCDPAEGVVKVDRGGVVTAIETAVHGSQAWVIATARDGGWEGRCSVTVERASAIHVTGVYWNPATETTTMTTTIGKGEERALSATVLPTNATNQDVTWSSSNPSVVSVNANGVLKGIEVTEVGEVVVITVKTSDGDKEAYCDVTVEEIEVTAVSVNKSELALLVGGSETLMANVQPHNASNKKVTWESTNPAIAYVGSSTGNVLALSRGTATITATTEDQGKIAECKVNVQSIFVVGQEKNSSNVSVAKRWINGAGTALSTDTTSHSSANSVAVRGNDVYAVGYETDADKKVAVLWKNFDPATLSIDRSGEAISVCVPDSGGVYVAGYEINPQGKTVATIWQNDDMPWHLSNVNGDACANSVFVSQGVVWSAGHEINDNLSYPMYWKGRERFILDGGDFVTRSASARSIFVVGNNVYVAGWQNDAVGSQGKPEAAIWVNGNPILLGSGVANSIFVAENGQIFVAGYRTINEGGLSVATLWRGNSSGGSYSFSPMSLGDGGSNSVANSVYLLGGDYYVVGYQTDLEGKPVATIWKNGFADPVETAGETASEAKAIVIK